MSAPSLPAHVDLEAVYRRRARSYDREVRLQSLLGFRQRAIHRAARDRLAVRPGDTVVDLGCGTGLNLPPMLGAAGQGRVVGIDQSRAMLDKAQERAPAAELRHADLSTARIPVSDAVLASFVLQFLPDARPLLERVVAALRPGGRIVLIDLEVPRLLRPLVLLVAKRFGHTWQTLARRPRRVLAALLPVQVERRFFGLVAITWAAKPGTNRSGRSAPTSSSARR